jgi:zinc protease
VAADTKSFNTPDKENAVFLAGTNLELRDDDPNYPALVIGNYILGGGFLNSRLTTRIRQKEGLSYGVNSRLVGGALDKAGSFSATVICAPQNEGKVATAFQEEVARALSEGFTAEEVSAAKSGYLQSRRVDLSDDGMLASGLAEQLFVGRDFHWEEKYQSHVLSLTPEQVSGAMRKFIDPQTLVVVSAGDFSKTRNR